MAVAKRRSLCGLVCLHLAVIDGRTHAFSSGHFSFHSFLILLLLLFHSFFCLRFPSTQAIHNTNRLTLSPSLRKTYFIIRTKPGNRRSVLAAAIYNEHCKKRRTGHGTFSATGSFVACVRLNVTTQFFDKGQYESCFLAYV